MPRSFIPYGRHVIDDADIAAVAEVLRGDWLTTGPTVDEFEGACAGYVGASYAVAASSGTAALHLCMLAAGIGPGDEVIVPALTFVASANCARYVGATVVFADVLADTLTIDPAHAESLITSRTRAIVGVDYGGLPCDLDRLMRLAGRHGLVLVEDACHALGAEFHNRPVGSIAHLSAFSFHPVKHMTTGEGGIVTTNDAGLAERLRRFRNHGITSDHRQREAQDTWRYDMEGLGYNYRLPDIQCALGLSQVRKLPRWLEHRRSVSARYSEWLSEQTFYRLPVEPSGRRHAWHLYAVRVTGPDVSATRSDTFARLRRAGIGVSVHYQPVYLHSYYRELGYKPGLCPVSEAAYDGLLSLPMWHGLSRSDQDRAVEELWIAATARA